MTCVFVKTTFPSGALDWFIYFVYTLPALFAPGIRKGYGHSVIFLAYFLTTLSSPKMKRDLLTVKQFSLTGMGLYRAMVRARCALVCLKAGEMPPVDTAAPSRFRMRSEPPSPELSKPGTSSPNRAILFKANDTGRKTA